MKRSVMVVVGLVLGGLLFAQEVKMSVGLTGGFSPVSIKYEDPSGSMEMTDNAVSVGAFFDATYVQLSVGYAFTVAKSKAKMTVGSSSLESEGEVQANWMDIQALGKYPFKVVENIEVFPLVGIEYWYALSRKTSSGTTPEDSLKYLRDWYLLFGAGVDIGVAKNIYIRPSVLYGINLTAKDENIPSDWKASGSTLKVNLAVGYTL
ncbi:MAG TPA: autotransporter outer membrane beta-barrel domain-containing protein [Termitinemataceae bacterium]|nr:autotransporter outer membrane beta-barrel domain-containing protein [Termitinemataceae bacterium]